MHLQPRALLGQMRIHSIQARQGLVHELVEEQPSVVLNFAGAMEDANVAHVVQRAICERLSATAGSFTVSAHPLWLGSGGLYGRSTQRLLTPPAPAPASEQS